MKLAALVLAFTAVLWGESKQTGKIFVFTNVNIVNTREGSILERVTVVIRNGRITGIAPIGLIDESRKTIVINATGKYLIPGLWDMHVHTAFSDPVWDEKLLYALYVANGITGVRDMGGDLDSLEQRRQHIERGELLGPRIVLGGPFLVGGKSDSQSVAVNTPQEARSAVDGLKKRHVDFIKILSNIPRDSYFAIAEEAKKVRLPLVGHVPTSVSVAEASNAGQKSIEHLTGFALASSSEETKLRQQILQAGSTHDRAAYFAAGREASESYDPAKGSALISLLAKNNTWQVPTLVWTQTQARLADHPPEADSILKYVPTSIRKQWEPGAMAKQTSAEQLAEYKRDAERNPAIVRDMHKAGVSFLAGSDGPDPMVVPGFSLHRELELLVESGFSPLEALRAATLNAAVFLGVSDKYGAVEKGHVADLVLLDANPLLDIRNTRKIAGVMLDGKYHSREGLDQVLATIESEAAKE
jgi:imidazolonepropionase-like amidohydrolase